MARRIDWTEEARADIRSLDRTTAMRIFDGIHRYSISAEGDVKALQGRHSGKFRLRLGDYRVFFKPSGEILRILNVKHRSEAYR